MNRRAIILVVMILTCSPELLAQINFHFGSENYRFNEKISYENSESRHTEKLGISYSFTVSENVTINAGIFKTDRISNINYDFASAKVYEPSWSIPIMVNYKISLNEKTEMIIAFGPGLTTTSKQEVLFANNTTFPDDFKSELGFGGNYKFSFNGRFGITQKITDKIYFFIMATGMREIEAISITQTDRPVFFHKSIGWESGVRFQF